MDTLKYEQTTKQAALRRVELGVEPLGESVLRETVGWMEAELAKRGPFPGRVGIWIDDECSFVVDGPGRSVSRTGTADCWFYIHPKDLRRLARGAMEPRQAVLFGRLRLREGDLRAAVRFGDYLGNRAVKERFVSDRPLPTPTRDRDQARADLAEYGYALVEGAMSPDQVRVVRSRVVAQAAAERELGIASGGEESQVVWSLLNKGQVFHDVLHHPLIDEFVPDMLGDYAILTGIVATIARPGNTAVTMHLDQSYVQPAIPQFPIGLNILWFLDDVSEANGGTRIMPGSHRSDVAPLDPTSLEGTVAAEGSAGTALLLDSRVWHSIGANRTDRARHVLVTYFNRSFMRAQENYFLSLRPEIEAELDERLKIMLGYRCTGSLGAVEGPIEGKLNSRPENPIGVLRPSVPSDD